MCVIDNVVVTCMLLIWFVKFTRIVIVLEFYIYILSWPSPVNGGSVLEPITTIVDCIHWFVSCEHMFWLLEAWQCFESLRNLKQSCVLVLEKGCMNRDEHQKTALLHEHFIHYLTHEHKPFFTSAHVASDVGNKSSSLERGSGHESNFKAGVPTLTVSS